MTGEPSEPSSHGHHHGAAPDLVVDPDRARPVWIAVALSGLVTLLLVAVLWPGPARAVGT